MPRTHKLTILAILPVLYLTFAAMSTGQPDSTTTLQAGDGLEWYKGNLHTHSHWSDGNDYLEMIALWYKERDYDFLCFTDHNVLADSERWVSVEKTKGGKTAYDKLKARFPDWIDERVNDDVLEVRLRTFEEVSEKIAEPGKYLLIQGEEISDRYESYPIHLNASNIQELIPPLGGESVLDAMQNNVNAVIAQRERTGQPILVHLNHPNFYYAITAEELMRVVGENFFEVYNGHPSVNNSGDDVHVSAERIWDVILTWRIAELDLPLMYGLAVDDGHEYHNIPSRASEPGRGWVVVLADELSPEALIESLESGRFYASSGVSLKSVAASPDKYEVVVDAEEGVEYTIDFIGTRQEFDATSEEVQDRDGNPVHTTRTYSDEVGQVLQSSSGPSATYRLAGDELYVRARVTSTKKHPNPAELGEFERAWCQPVLGPAAKAD